jgi:hypothetical protein
MGKADYSVIVPMCPKQGYVSVGEEILWPSGRMHPP